MAAATGKGVKLVLVLTAISLVCVLVYSLAFRVQHPFLTEQRRERPGQQQQASERPSQEAMDRIASLMSRIQEDPQDVQALSEVARLFMSMQSYERAATFWERVLRVTPDRTAPRQRLAMCYYRLKRYEDAAKELRRVLEQEPDNAYAHYNLGVLLSRFLQQPDQGRRHFRRVLDADGADAELKDRARRELSQSSGNTQ